MKRIGIILGIFLAISGCASNTQWTHNTKTAADFEQDRHACLLEVEQRTANWGAQGNVFLMADWARDCMKLKGWRVYKGETE